MDKIMKDLSLAKGIVLIVALLALSGCVTKGPESDISLLYQKSAEVGSHDRNPVIVIPGILGSQIRNTDTHKIVWGTRLLNNANGATSEGLQTLSLPMREGVPLSELADNNEAFAAIDAISLSRLFSLIELKAYRNILMTLGAGGYIDETLAETGDLDYGDDHFSCFQFPYDWRRSCAENAVKLDAFIREKEEYVQAECLKRYGKKKENLKFDIVAHSMGGLILRYYMRYGTQPLGTEGPLPTVTWEGAKKIEKAILVGSPHLGSMSAFRQLHSGFRTIPGLPKYFYPSSALGTMPSIFELLPRVQYESVIDSETLEPYDLLKLENWVDNQWGALDPKEDSHLKKLLPEASTREDRYRIALDQLSKCVTNASRFHASLDFPAERPEELYIELFIGDSVSTETNFIWDASTRKIKSNKWGAGDGTVPRYSALGELNWTQGETREHILSSVPYNKVTFVFDSHLGLTSNASFTDNMLFTLLKL